MGSILQAPPPSYFSLLLEMQSHIDQEQNSKPIFKANATTTRNELSRLGCRTRLPFKGAEIWVGILENFESKKIDGVTLKSAKSWCRWNIDDKNKNMRKDRPSIFWRVLSYRYPSIYDISMKYRNILISTCNLSITTLVQLTFY